MNLPTNGIELAQHLREAGYNVVFYSEHPSIEHKKAGVLVIHTPGSVEEILEFL